MKTYILCYRRAFAKLEQNPCIFMLGSHTAPRVPIFSFLTLHPLTGRLVHHNFISALLSDLYDIQARGGCACAGPYAEVSLLVSFENKKDVRNYAFITIIFYSDIRCCLQNKVCTIIYDCPLDKASCTAVNICIKIESLTMCVRACVCVFVCSNISFNDKRNVISNFKRLFIYMFQCMYMQK